MISVSNRTKNAFINGGEKHLELHIIKRNDGKLVTDDDAVQFDKTIPESKIVADSMVLSQELISSGELNISGCISSKFEIEIYGLRSALFGYLPTPADNYYVKASIYVTDKNGDTGDVIPLFYGLITKVDSPTNIDRTKLEAHDDFYTMQNLESTSLGNIIANSEIKRGSTSSTASDVYPCTLKQFMNPLWQWLFTDGLRQGRNHCATLDSGIANLDLPLNQSTVNLTLPRPDYSNTEITPLEFFRKYMELNCMLGYIDGNGVFKIYAPKVTATVQDVNFYKSVYISTDTQSNITNATIVNSDDDIIYTDGDGSSYTNYEVGNSCFTDTLIKQVVKATPSIMNKIEGVFGEEGQVPYNITTVGMPWVEVGKDAISFTVESHDKASYGGLYEFRVFNRKLSGIQNLTDNFYYSTTVSPSKKKHNLQNKILMIESSRPVTRCVTEVPSTFASNTIYFVRKS